MNDALLTPGVGVAVLKQKKNEKERKGTKMRRKVSRIFQK